MRTRLGMAGMSLRSRWLGQEMRGLREGRGMTIRHVAEHVGGDFAVAARFERGEELFDEDRILALLDLYLVFDRVQRDRLLCLARAAWQPPIFDALDGDRDPSFLDLLWLEQRAERIRCYSPAVVPDLLRTAGYAEALIRADRPDLDDAKVERKVSALVHRQAILHGTPPVRLEVVLAGCVLNRPVGPGPILTGQVRHLGECQALPNVDVRVQPVEAGYVLGMAGPYTVFDLPSPYPIVAVVPHLGGWLLSEGGDSAPYATAFERLHAAASTPFPSLRVEGELSDAD